MLLCDAMTCTSGEPRPSLFLLVHVQHVQHPKKDETSYMEGKGQGRCLQLIVMTSSQKQYLGCVGGSKEGIEGHGGLTGEALRGSLGSYALGNEPVHQLLQCCIIHPRIGRQCLLYEVMHLQAGRQKHRVN